MSKVPSARDIMGGHGDVVRKKKAPDDSTLQKLWRKVVRKEWDNRCALRFHGGGNYCAGPLECHHIIKRTRPHLKHAPTNGILLCKVHHDQVEGWAAQIAGLLGEDKMEWLRGMQRKLFPEFLRERGQTRIEYLCEQKRYLEALLKDPDWLTSREVKPVELKDRNGE